MSDAHETSEFRASYRTLNDPTRLLGLSVGALAALAIAAGIGYAFLSFSPLPWRANLSAVVIGIGAPVFLLILREPGTIGPGALLLAVLRWRVLSTSVTAPAAGGPMTGVAVHLDAQLEDVDEQSDPLELPWTAEAIG